MASRDARWHGMDGVTSFTARRPPPREAARGLVFAALWAAAVGALVVSLAVDGAPPRGATVTGDASSVTLRAAARGG